MATQRSRRAALRAAAAGTGLLAGCATWSLPTGPVPSGRPVSLMAAGSLANALEHGLRPALDIPVHVEARGSAAIARLVADGHRSPGIVSLADVALFSILPSVDWHAAFATNAVVLAYNPHTAAGRRVGAAGADRWYEPLRDGVVSLGRTDPDLDPLGYRTLFTLDLAARYYDVPGLRDAVTAPDQRYPETELVSRLETGAIDAAFVYRNMAVDRGYAYVRLPPQIDLSDPGYVADWYRTVSYTLPDGTTIVGDLIRYGSTVLADDPPDRVRRVFEAHTTGGYLGEFGFEIPADYPRYVGEVPDAVPA